MTTPITLRKTGNNMAGLHLLHEAYVLEQYLISGATSISSDRNRRATIWVQIKEYLVSLDAETDVFEFPGLCQTLFRFQHIFGSIKHIHLKAF